MHSTHNTQRSSLCFWLLLPADVAHAGYHNLHFWSYVATKKVQLVKNHQGNSLYRFPLSPSSTQHIPLFDRGNDKLTLGKQSKIGGGFSGQFHNFFCSKDRTKAIFPIVEDG